MQSYEKLVGLPLFTGMGKGELEDVVAHTKMNFVKLSPGKTIVSGNDKCDKLIILTNGSIKCVTSSFDRGFSVVEILNAPWNIEPNRLFGLKQRFFSSFYTVTESSFIFIDKKEVINMCQQFPIFLFNYLNSISRITQITGDNIWKPRGNSTEEVITNFLLYHCIWPAGKKTYNIIMKRLMKETRCTRRSVSKTLKEMRDKGLISLERGKIQINQFELLLSKG